ncbi:MAG: phosphodiester glycosidase family protein [Deltaproteobacteria bacterium]
MNASWCVGARLLSALALLGLARCAREEAARPAGAPIERSSAAGVIGVRDAASPPAATLPASAAAPVFQTLVAGLSVLADERTDAEGHAHEWIVTRIDLQQHRLQVRALGDVPFTRLLGDAGLLVAVNGGFFDPDLQASGLLLSGGSLLARERPGGGSGVLAVVKQRARLLKRGEPLPRGTDFSVQCGPRLIEVDGALGIRSDDRQRAARTAACIRERGRELNFVVARGKGPLRGGPGLLQLAEWLAQPLAPGEPSGCEAALNLDGGPSTGIVVAGPPELVRAPLGPVPFALVVAR